MEFISMLYCVVHCCTMFRLLLFFAHTIVSFFWSRSELTHERRARSVDFPLLNNLGALILVGAGRCLSRDSTQQQQPIENILKNYNSIV